MTVPNANPVWRESRLRRHGDYQRLYAASRKQFVRHTAYFTTVRVADPRHPVPAHPRVGLTVGRIMGDAPTRNRIKRRFREAIRKHLHLLGNLEVDVALHPKRGAQDLPWEALERDVAVIFRAVAKASAA